MFTLADVVARGVGRFVVSEDSIPADGSDVCRPDLRAGSARDGLNAVKKWSHESKRDYAALPDGTEVLDSDEQPVETFLVELERMLLTGHSLLEVKRWATRELGLSLSTFERYVEILRGTWRLETTTHFALQQRRDELRAMYRHVYHRAMDDEAPELLIALKAIDSMSKLDGLAMPDVAVQVNQTVSDGVANQTVTQLTNKTRERTMELLRLARERAEKHAERTTKTLTDGRSDSGEERFRVPQMGVVR